MERGAEGLEHQLTQLHLVNREVIEQTYLRLFSFLACMVCTFSVMVNTLRMPIFTVGIGRKLAVMLSGRFIWHGGRLNGGDASRRLSGLRRSDGFEDW